GEVVAKNAAGIERLFGYRAMQNPGTLAKLPWVLLTEIDQDDELRPLRQLRNELLGGILILVAFTLFIASNISSSIRKPLDQVRECARRIGAGDLSQHVEVAGRDVAGALASTLNDMIKGLQERDRVKDVFGRYVARQAAEKILKGEVPVDGEARTVSILFSDIRNFTGMSEQMTPQQVIAFLNDYFSEMVNAVCEQEGIGDGLMAEFGAMGDQPDHARRAVVAALRMKALVSKINGERTIAGKPPIAIGIGIHTDEVIVGNIGTKIRSEYTVIGDGVNAA